MIPEWKSWESESALVSDFIGWARFNGFECYSETAGWDLLIVRKEDGFQIGIEAKLSLNATVLLQALQKRNPHIKEGPDCHAVLVPEKKTTSGLPEIARYLNIVVITGAAPRQWVGWKGATFEPKLPASHPWWMNEQWPELCPDRRHTLPAYVPDVIGGKSGPVKLTLWKISAIKATILLNKNGKITRDQLRTLGLDPRRWTDGWLKSDGDGAWVKTPLLPDFKKQHPRNYKEILADFAEWNPVP